MDPEEFKAIRIDLFGTQAAAAAIMGVSIATVKSWEHGRRQIPEIAVKFLELTKAHRELLDRDHVAGF